MKRRYVKVTGDGEVLSDALIDSTARAVAMVVEGLKAGGTVTVRGNAYEIEAIWNPPLNRKPAMPEVREDASAPIS